MEIVTLYDGREVDSASEEWRAECEARTVLAMDLVKRADFFQLVEAKRGADAVRVLRERCFDLEPHYVLNLPNKPQRTAYLDQVERRFGPNPRKALEEKIMALHRARQAVATETAASA